jgi:hypothetical protein
MKEYLFKGIEMEPMTLSFGVILGFIQRAIAKIKDPRLASNATRYSIKDLVALDGTQYFSSQTIHCECCSSRTHKNGTVTYFHSAILPVIVAPTQPQVISLAPEFLTPQVLYLKTKQSYLICKI